MNGRGDSMQQAPALAELPMGEPLPPEPSRIECTASRSPKRSDHRLRELVDQHLDIVWRYLRRIGHSAADCDEIVQEAFLVASRRMDDIRIGCERSYLLHVAGNIASTRRRSFSRELVRIDQSAITCPQQVVPDPEQAIAVRQAQQELDAILTAMPLELRQVFVLYEIEELSTPQIALLLELKEGTVASRLRRARFEFRRQIEERSRPPTRIRPFPEGGEP